MATFGECKAGLDKEDSPCRIGGVLILGIASVGQWLGIG